MSGLSRLARRTWSPERRELSAAPKPDSGEVAEAFRSCGAQDSDINVAQGTEPHRLRFAAE
jgi:hypothetical protein